MKLNKSIIGMVHLADVGWMNSDAGELLRYRKQIGSGIDSENIQEYWDFADAFIVGSSLKKEGNWENEVDRNRVVKLMDQVKRLKLKATPL